MYPFYILMLLLALASCALSLLSNLAENQLHELESRPILSLSVCVYVCVCMCVFVCLFVCFIDSILMRNQQVISSLLFLVLMY
jgi:hypothetical protein